MTVPMLTEGSSLDVAWSNVTYTEARLLGDEIAKEWAPTFTTFRKRIDDVRIEQRGTWREGLVAQAMVNAADDALDDCVRQLDLTLRHLLAGETDSPRYRRYLSSAPSTIIRMGLESEQARLRGWPESLSSEPEPELKALADKFRAVLAQGEAALQARSKAEGLRTDHRVRAINTLIDDINNARLSLYGILAQKAVDLKLPRTWPDRFFQHTARAVKSEAEPTAPMTTAPAQTTTARPTS